MSNAQRDSNYVTTLLAVSSVDGVTPVTLYANPVTHRLLVDLSGGGSGTVQTVSVATANGLAGTSDGNANNPILTLSTTVNGLVKGNGTSLSAVTIGTGLSFDGTTLSATGGAPGGSTTQVQYNNAGAFGGITGATTNGTTLTLVAPILGTPASGTLTNCTGLPVSSGISGLGTGVATALAINVGTAGSVVTNGGALGTPSSGTVTNLTGTASININGTVGATTPTTGVFTTLVAGSATSLLLGTAGSAVGSIGFRNATSGTLTVSPPTGALGTIAITLPNANSTLPIYPQQITYTGPTAARTITLPDANFTVARTDAANTFTGVQTMTSPSITTSIVTASTTFTAWNTTATTFSMAGAATTLTIGGTPTTAITHNYSTNATAAATTKTVNLGTGGAASSTTNINIGASAGGTTTISSPTISLGGTTGATTTGTIELGAASDTTLSRSSAGVLAVEGVVIPSISSTNTLTNKRVTPRVNADTSNSATPTNNTDNFDVTVITGQTNNITSMTTNLSGTPTNGQLWRIAMTAGSGTPTVTWGSSFEDSTVTAPTALSTTRVDVGFVWNAATSKWRCVARA